MADQELSFEDWLDQYKKNQDSTPSVSGEPQEPGSSADDTEAKNYPAGSELPEITAAEAAAQDKATSGAEEAPQQQAQTEQAPDESKDEEAPEKGAASKKSAKKETSGDKEEEKEPADLRQEALDKSETPMDFLSKLREAQAQEKKNLALAQIQRGGAQMLAGATRTAPDYTEAQALEKQAELPFKHLQQEIGVSDIQSKLQDRQEMMNPQSETSKMLRDFANRFGFKLSDNVSGAHIAQVAPFMVKAFEAEENRKARVQVAEENREARREVAELRSSGQDKKSQDMAYSKALDKINTSRLPPDVKQAKMDEYLASKAQLIFSKYPDLNSIPDAQKHQLLLELGKLGSGGVPTSAELKGLDPQTWKEEVNKFVGRLTNVPQGAEIGAFLKQQQDYINDLSKNARDRVDAFHSSVADEYAPLMGADREAQFRKSIARKAPPGTMVKIQDSQGGFHEIPADKLDKAKERDPGLKILQ